MSAEVAQPSSTWVTEEDDHDDHDDEAGNEVQSENFVLFTPIQEKNIIDLIIENFESTFGWVKNIAG